MDRKNFLDEYKRIQKKLKEYSIILKNHGKIKEIEFDRLYYIYENFNFYPYMDTHQKLINNQLKKNKENRILYFNEIKENKDLFNKWINIIYSLMYLLESNNYYHNKLNWMC
jgi:ERCC4-related helicase